MRRAKRFASSKKLIAKWVDYDECTGPQLEILIIRHNQAWAQTPKNGLSHPPTSRIFMTIALPSRRASIGAAGVKSRRASLFGHNPNRHGGAASAPRPSLAGSSAIEGTAVMKQRGRVRLFMTQAELQDAATRDIGCRQRS